MSGSVSAPAGPAPPGPFAAGTLGRQLLLRVVLIVAAIAVLISATSVLVTHRVLMSNVDADLSSVVDGFRRGPGQQTGDNLLQPGQPQGTLYAVFGEGSAEPAQMGMLQINESGPAGRHAVRITLPEAAVDELADLDPDADPTTVSLPGVGRYRVAAYPATLGTPAGPPAMLVVGIPVADADRVLIWAIGVASTLSLLAIGAAVVAVGSVVRRSLRPLNRVAATAQQVSGLRLDRGEVELPIRVPAADADPISEVGRVGQALNHLLDNVGGALTVRQASETKLKRFIADASHELRNPLAAIGGYAELTRRGRDELPADTAYALDRMESESARMSALVEDLLLLARLDSGPNIDLDEVDLNELLINAVSDARAAGRDHRWRLDLGDPVSDPGPTTQQPSDSEAAVLIPGDRHRLHQVLANLLANARTHTPAGTTVTTGLRVDHDQAVITVADDGPGIPSGIGDQVFERFTRADSSRARTGSGAASTGLGLAIVAAVVSAHQGTVAVHSRPGDTRFEIRLPRTPRTVAESG